MFISYFIKIYYIFRGNCSTPQRSSSLTRLEMTGMVLTNDPFVTVEGDGSRHPGRHRIPRPQVIHHDFSELSPSEVRMF